MQPSPIGAGDWDRIAGGFDELVTPLNVAAGERVIGILEVDTGQQFLDVAAGTGALSLPAARAGADVLATDISPAMVKRLSARALQAGLSNLEARVMDGTALELEDGAFDVAASQHGVSIFPDMARGLQEMVRVVKPGGSVCVSAFGPLQRVAFVHTFLDAVKAAVPGAPVPSRQNPPLPFQASDSDVLAGRLEAAGLVGVQVRTITHEASFASPEAYWKALVNSNPIGAGLASKLNERERSTALEVVERALAQRPAAGGGGVLASELNVGIGTKPEGAS